MNKELAAWRQQKAEVFAHQAKALETARLSEHQAATKLIEAAIRDYLAAGIKAQRLYAKPYHGKRAVRTNIIGWYLKHDRTIGIDTKANYYILAAPGDLITRLQGAKVQATQAPLEVGRGGKDGELFKLAELLKMRLTDPVLGKG